jgi:hypothetical protein
MDNIVSLVAGILFKVVDEIEDTDIQIPEEYKYILKFLFTISVFVCLYNNVLLSLILVVFMIPVCFYVKQVDTVFWKSIISIPIITLILQINLLQIYTKYDMMHLIIYYLPIQLIFAVMEAKMFPEETSERKTIARIYTVFALLIALLLAPYVLSSLHTLSSKYIEFIMTGLIILIGYFSTSIISKSLVLQNTEIIGPLYASRIHAKGGL